MATFQVETEQHGELNCWRITSNHAELLIAQQGAQVLSYQRLGEPPLLWLSDQAIFRQGKSVRAGVPVCWPWFGNLQRNPQAVQAMYQGEQAPAHGLARTRDWQLLGIEEAAEGLRIEFSLPEALGDLPGWPHEVELKLLIEMGTQLKLTLSSFNQGNDNVTISQALHSYFAVSDVRQARVEGVENLGYIETLADWELRQQHSALGFAGETDRIYLQTPDLLKIVDPQWNRRITLHATGSRSAVIWNPWTDRARELADMADDGWQRMLCIETANVWDDVVNLAPGASHSLSVTITSEAL
ncbi:MULTISPECIES: D-hexose-6-phosphate mutarotase [Pseudomonas]|uniref:Putative glucose-6-phosphate 1-epimerase n=2 Tax=Pseudomonas TaxID=286 RepID=A0AAX0W3U7_9PSED|nr:MULTISPECIES: D-hexose-6-phosphate mutarotase [Pseudomonas]MBH3356773.1 D-hexose-6-phosphate mutarotase [Pseudomonas guariconensis]MCO7621019.1 D-hexose-6-phosphate mutarotase [Pseudomonas guariconensis]MEB3839584.1 D-hexose-6-phosphate mutarotase [Pseudomonas guariconensis]MEB3872452.1 D-hexose-6-phosphate mutarotase [Pseudomonas guariconensis]MEB3880410.1 D-hexose-6-phosphate mutarotase [Pseudomonas guariconensis]